MSKQIVMRMAEKSLLDLPILRSEAMHSIFLLLMVFLQSRFGTAGPCLQALLSSFSWFSPFARVFHFRYCRAPCILFCVLPSFTSNEPRYKPPFMW